MLYFNRIDIIEGIDPAKSNKNKECIIYHSWFFNEGFEFQDSVCSGCHDLTMMCFNISNIAIITVKGIDYRFIVNDIRKSEAINFLENSVLDDRGYIKNACQRNQY